MKRPGLIILSLGLNLLLVGTVAWAVHRRNSTPPITSTKPATVAAPAISVTTQNPLDVAPAQTNEVTAPFNWSMVESTDYQTYVTNLHGIGCPEQRIRDIIIADVDDLFAQRARDYIAPLQSQFWQLASHPRDIEKNIQEHGKALERLIKEREQLFQALFNESNPRRSWRNTQRDQNRTANRDAQLDFLDETKRAAVIAAQNELNSVLSEIRQMKFTGTREEVRSQRNAKETEARKASEEKLRALLTPEEFAEHKLRNSDGAGVRYQLARMSVSETEAHSIAQIVAAKAEGESDASTKDAATKTAKEEREQRAQEQIKQLLGDTRYAEYQRVTDGRYDQTARLIERLELPEQTAVAVYEARREAEKLADRLRADTSASTEERAAALKIIRTEAENSVRRLVGDSAFKDFARHAGWMEALAHPAK